MCFSIIFVNMISMLINYSIHIMFIIDMVMPRDIVSYTICIAGYFDVIFADIEINKFIHLSYTAVIISVYGIMCLNNDITSKLTVSFFRFETLLVL